MPGGARLDLLKQVLPEFSKENPNITVDFQPKDQGMCVMLTADAAAGTLPHVTLGAGQFFHEFVQKGILLDITETVERLKIIADSRGSTPCFKKLQTGDRYLSPPPDNMKVPVEAISYAVAMPFNVSSQQWPDAITKALDPAFAGAQSVPDAAKEATRLGDLALAGVPAQ